MGVRRKRIIESAQRLLDENAVSSPPVPVERIARRSGLRVSLQALESDLSGFLYRDEEATVIGVNSSQSRVRQRFTISHELGHFLLHDSGKLHVDRTVQARFRNDLSSSGTDPEEIEANQFAAVLLMPGHFVAADMAQLQGATDILDEATLTQLARRYDVSPQAFLLRLINLGYVEQ